MRARRSALFPALGWTLFIVILAVLAWTMLGACGISVGGQALLQFCKPIEPPWDSRAPETMAAERAYTRQLKMRLDDLQRGISAVQACPAPPPPAPQQRVEAPPQQRVEAPPPPMPVPDEPRTATPPARDEPAATESRPDPNKVTKLDAPPDCPVETPAELLLVIDTSGSMEFKYAADPQLERRLLELEREANRGQPRNIIEAMIGLGRINRLSQEHNRLTRALKEGPGPDRMTVAKTAANELLDAIPPVVDTTLVTFQGCGRYEHAGPFTAATRGALKQRIDRLRPHDATPLARTLESLPQLTGKGRTGEAPVNIVVISDGQDSCNADPCTAARRLKERMPFAVVSVVAVSQNIGTLRCIADATKGLFLEAHSIDELETAVRQAAGRERSDQCR